MSTRTIIEINHDYLGDLVIAGELLAYIMRYLRSMDLARAGEVGEPVGIRILGQRDHSEPEWKPGSEG